MNAPAVRIENLTVALPKGADRAEALTDVSLDLHRGEILCVVGESGSGKSMLANAIMGLLPEGVAAKQGRIHLGETDLLALTEAQLRDLRGRRMAMIFQEPMSALNPLMRVGDQIAEMFEAHDQFTDTERRARALKLIEEVGLPDPPKILRAYPFQLSGGQRQRVMIAMALALEPTVLIADEPTTALDVTTQAQILALIKQLQATHGTAVLFITHDFGVVAEIADRIAVMQNGVLVELGTAQDVLSKPTHDYTQRLIAAVPSLTPPKSTPLKDTPEVLSADRLSKTYSTRSGWFSSTRNVKAVDDVGFILRKGETLGLVGESGSGKSTVGRCLVRLIEPDRGTIKLSGDVVSGTDAVRRARRRMQMVFQDPFASLNPRHRVGHILTAGQIAHGTTPAAARVRAADLLTLVGLSASALDRFPHEFSGGQRQRIGIARALALDPEILIADEPVSALDVSVQAQVLALINDLKTQLQLSMLFITHDLRVAAQVCDRIAVMQMGRIVEIGDTAAVFANPQHDYTKRLLASVPGVAWSRQREHAR